MGFDNIIEDCRKMALVSIEGVDLQPLLDRCEILRENDTCLSGWIRILQCAELVLVQEQTPQGEVLLRRVGNEDEAITLVDDRLATYERMWDGCGCKIHYHEE